MRAYNRIKKSWREQGFTLVEIIVVLVILAILAAFTIPTMLGFVEDAKGKAYIAEAREVYVAAQAVATEMVGSGRSDLKTTSTNNPYDALNSYWVSRCDERGSDSFENPASMQMKKYLEKDMLKITKNSYRQNYGKDESYWYVRMGGSKGYENKEPGTVQEVYYVKNDYVVWFKEGNVTVEKLKINGDDRPDVPWSE
ncbi:type II secretion system protein [Acetobacterium wieringae]|uniref:type II secretion system protein n=1 Tax=Acetobacterium wieringae TaxID=52694 RepID=UPI0021F3142F|nr:type II secretion system protein [Acetobacterium wieringae]